MGETVHKTDTARYDRQLRLWGEEGQSRLESAKICLLNATAMGTETLKNLVLPGIGSFVVVDGVEVNEGDLNNFFVEYGQSKQRAEVTVQLLQELNPLVKGTFESKDPKEVIFQNPEFFDQFTVVIATALPEEPLLRLSQICWRNKIPLFVIRCCGLIGYLRISTPEHTIIESKPDNPPDDLHLACPFPELLTYAKTFDLPNLNSAEHSHVPFIVILLHCIETWKAQHGDIPKSYADRRVFKESVLKLARSADEQNFMEAHKSAHKACTLPTIPASVQAILEDPKANQLSSHSEKFWLLAGALKQFVNQHQMLPLMGSIPDMTTTTGAYVDLQKIYQEKAAQDIAEVEKYLSKILEGLGIPREFISYDEVKHFCKNAYFLEVVRYSSLDQELSAANSVYIDNHLKEENSNMNWYLLFRAAEKFYQKFGSYPGESPQANLQKDYSDLQQCTQLLCEELKLQTSVDEKFIQEMVRYGAAEVHPIAALLGGVAAQEIIKLITHQYIPMNNTFVFNGIHSTSTTYTM